MQLQVVKAGIFHLLVGSGNTGVGGDISATAGSSTAATGGSISLSTGMLVVTHQVVL